MRGHLGGRPEPRRLAPEQKHDLDLLDRGKPLLEKLTELFADDVRHGWTLWPAVAFPGGQCCEKQMAYQPLRRRSWYTMSMSHPIMRNISIAALAALTLLAGACSERTQELSATAPSATLDTSSTTVPADPPSTLPAVPEPTVDESGFDADTTLTGQELPPPADSTANRP